MTAERLNDAQLLRASELFDEEFYLHTYPDVVDSGFDAVRHYLRVGWILGYDPSARFSTRGYLDANHDVAQRRVNPLVHYVRMGRLEGRELNPMLKVRDLIVDSGFFDADYYRHFHPELLPDVDPAMDYLIRGARTGADPSERFSTTEYLRNYADVAAGTQNPLVHYLRHGQKEKRAIWPGRARRPQVSEAVAQQWPELAALPLTSVPGTAPRVTVLLDDVNSFDLPATVGVALALAVEVATAAGGSLRLVTRHVDPDAGIVRAVAAAMGVEADCQVELDRLEPAADHALPVRASDLVVATSWASATAAERSTLLPDQLLWVLGEDPRDGMAGGDQRVWCERTLARVPLAVLSPGLRDQLTQSGTESVVRVEVEPAAVSLPGRDADGERRRLLVWADPARSTDAFWLGIDVLSQAIEEGILDPQAWDLTLMGAGVPELTLPAGVRPEVVRALPADADLLSPLGGFDAAMLLQTAAPASFPALDLVSAGVPVVAVAQPWALSDHETAALVVCEPQPADLLAALNRTLRAAEAAIGPAPARAGSWHTSLQAAAEQLVRHGREHLGWEGDAGVR